MKRVFKSFPFVAQHDSMDCGPACLAMISEYYGKKHSLQFLRDHSYLTREGVSLIGLTEAATQIGFDSMALRLTIDDLIIEKAYPSVLYWNNYHFVVLYGINRNIFSRKYSFKIADPSTGFITIPENKFRESWLNPNNEGVVFAVEPTAKFIEIEQQKGVEYNLKYLLGYISPYKKHIFQLFLSLSVGSLLTLAFPFLAQALIDKGVNVHNLNIVFLILLAQICIFLGSVVIEVVRNWLVLYIGARINISIISDFFRKIMKLPIKFFDTKFTGDFYQRIQDHTRIENFLTSQSLTTFFSLVNFLIFFIVLFHYNTAILCVYIILTISAIIWSRIFLKKREILDYFRFKTNSLNQEAINEMIFGIQDIKLNNFEHYKIEKWEKVQTDVFGINLKVLKLDQLQLIGFDFINQIKNIVVTYLAARLVILGDITLGGMLSISYIIGQMNSPVNQLIGFFRSLQDAQLSMKRLTEVQNINEEEDLETQTVLDNIQKERKGIEIKNVSFQYEGPLSPFVLKDIDLYIPEGKTTAIVGSSGCGKTTLMKLLLRFYEPINGEITINGHKLDSISPLDWRKKCGVVMQEGYIFSETIARNIATNEFNICPHKLSSAIRIANITDFIESLPFKENTIVGSMGNGISSGQRQRLLIARAVYKQPQYIFLDEATSSLDTENEKIIYDNLNDFLINKTVVVIAHRLSTVKNADQIVVLKDGKIVEIGNHKQLILIKGVYYNLVRNQLELDNNL
jgi:ATP-binding cassette subfamily B protein